MGNDPYVDQFGVPLRRDSVEQILRECAAHAPGERREQRQAWGFNWAAKLLDENRNTPVYAEALRVLREMLASADTDQVRLAATFLPPGELAGAVRSAFERADLDDGSRTALRSRISSLVASGGLPWSPSLRDELTQPGGGELIGPALVHDHAWVLSNLKRLLGDDAVDARMRLSAGIPHLRRCEVQRLRDELSARRAELGEAWTDEQLSALDYFLAEEPLDEAPGVRW